MSAAHPFLPLLERLGLDLETPPGLDAWRTVEAELAEQSAYYQHILNSVPVEIVVFDADHRYQFINPTAIKDSALRDWLIGKDDFEYCAYRGYDPALAETRRQRFQRALDSQKTVQWEETFYTAESVKYHWRNLSPVYGVQGEFQMMLGYGHDVTVLTEARNELRRAHDDLELRVDERTRELAEAKGWLEQANEQLQHDAFHDALTGLPNRALFKDRLGQAIERFNRCLEGGFAVLFLDFDRFKVIPFYSRINRCRLPSVSVSCLQQSVTTAPKMCCATPTSPCTAPRRSARRATRFLPPSCANTR